MNNIKIIKETLAYTAYDITVYVKINYEQNKISLVEPNGNYGAYKAKNWVFTDRGIEYVYGWKNIFSY
jgi:nuclear transport factor 2 (NTF2) superfamily protein